MGHGVISRQPQRELLATCGDLRGGGAARGPADASRGMFARQGSGRRCVTRARRFRTVSVPRPRSAAPQCRHSYCGPACDEFRSNLSRGLSPLSVRHADWVTEPRGFFSSWARPLPISALKPHRVARQKASSTRCATLVYVGPDRTGYALAWSHVGNCDAWHLPPPEAGTGASHGIADTHANNMAVTHLAEEPARMTDEHGKPTRARTGPRDVLGRAKKDHC